jgi:hypothetical protein
MANISDILAEIKAAQDEIEKLRIVQINAKVQLDKAKSEVGKNKRLVLNYYQ